MTQDEIKELFNRIVGKLQDEGWPVPYNQSVYPTQSGIIWREGDDGSALCLSWDKGHAFADRWTLSMQVLLDKRYVMIDIRPSLEIHPGSHHDAETICRVLRHFRSVIDPQRR